MSVSAYDPATGAWRHTDRIPLDAFVGPAVWTGDRLVFLTWGPDDSLANGAYDPTARTWTPWDLPCSTSARGTAWTGDLLISDDGKRALDPDAMTCHRVPAPPFRTLGGDVLAWTDEELISWSGIRALAERPRPRGIALRLQDPERT